MDLIFQDTGLKWNDIERNLIACHSINYYPKTFGLIPVLDEVSMDFELLNPTILFGSTKLVKLFLKGCLPKNAILFYYQDKFDQKYYSNRLGTELLNYGAMYTTWGKIKNAIIENPIFIKPSSDIKYFNGQILYPSRHSIEGAILEVGTIGDDLVDDVSVLVTSKLVNILVEYRVVVINKNIIDISQYVLNKKIIHSEVSYGMYMKVSEYVYDIMELYNPHSHYVIDIALIDNEIKLEYKVIEYNCINCSGLYETDRTKIYQEFLNL